ncbi:MAG TPA: tripartite tricarboxylate transporter substrate-binding protein [Xanthobacteraceae bacterium]|jgi:tripartite-type tricarboxylate transporter receptor subunit TctC
MLKRSKIPWLALAAGLMSVSAVVVFAAAPQEFYAGKTLTIIVPAAPGGGYDLWPRLMSPYLQKYLGVAQVKIENRPGGGGLVGTNAIYSSPADGLTIADTNAAGDVFAEMAKTPGVGFQTVKLNWIGRPDDDPHIIAVHPDSRYKTFGDIQRQS